MAFPDDVFPTGDHCEICGAELGNEVVIQEFADGTFARLCPECHTGATFGRGGDTAGDPFAAADRMSAAPSRLEADISEERGPQDPIDAFGPQDAYGPEDAFGSEEAFDVQSPTHSSGSIDSMDNMDPMEMTKELLIPVADLIGLQGEMQIALERLAGSLDRFASHVVTDSIDKTTSLENRIKSLETELERTRDRLRETESLLIVTGSTGAIASQTAPAEAEAIAVAPLPSTESAVSEAPPPVFTPTAPSALPGAADDGKMDTLAADEGMDTIADPAASPDSLEKLSSTYADLQALATETEADLTREVDMAGYWTTVGTPSVETDPAQPAPPPTPAVCTEVFDLNDVRLTQRHFNESTFTSRMRDVRRSLGRPRVNLSRVSGVDPRALVTIYWDIVWYQYLVDLRREGVSGPRVTLFREGMELEELNECFKQKNASMDDDGRLDASELEVQLLSDPTVLITELPPEEEKALEDATEEIWDNRMAPEFKWDD